MEEEPLHQLRLGVAMSGAIALVLYESGVAHETLRFLRGWNDRKDAVTAYGKAFQTIPIQPIVDILTGASAGGINSVLMANCIAGGADFATFRQTWIEMAGVDKLRYGRGVQPRSLLDTTPLIAQIRQQMQNNVIQNNGSQNAAGPPQELEDLDVRLCRTDILGHCESTRDSLHHQIDVDSKANVIRFATSHFTDSCDDQIRKLVDAACATSAFPGAFPPVQDENVWYTDGGLWDNQPVDLAVKAVADKPAFGVTHRCILFTDPDPARAIDPNAARAAVPEPPVTEIAAQLPFMGIKGSLWPALKNILDYNRRSRVYQCLLEDISPAMLKQLGGSLKAQALSELQTPSAASEMGVVNQVRFEALLLDDDPALINRWHGLMEGLNAADAAQTLQAALETLKAIGLSDLERRTCRRQLEEINDQLKSQPDQAPRSPSLEKATLYRRIGQITAYLQKDSDSLANPELRWRLDKEQSRFRAVTAQMLAALEARQAAQQLAAAPPAPLAPLLTHWADAVSAQAAQARRNLNSQGAAAADPRLWSAASVEKSFSRQRPAQAVSFMQASSLKTTSEEPYSPPEMDILRCVIAAVSDLVEKKPIDLVRISPNDTDNLHLIGQTHSATQTDAVLKLAGEGLGHMTGFLEERWRRNDYIWGRLDACEILLKTLRRYAPQCGPEISNAVYEHWLAEAQAEILRDEAEAFDIKNTGLAAQVGSEIAPLEKGVAPQWTAQEKSVQAANRQIIGKGGETWQDADQPGFADNLHYLARTAARLLQGDADKPPGALSYLERIARLNAYLVRGITWVVAPPASRESTRHFTVATGAVALCAAGLFVWGWAVGNPEHTGLAQNVAAGLLGAVFCVALGGVIGWRFGAVVWAALGAGLIAGLSLPASGPETRLALLTAPWKKAAPAQGFPHWFAWAASVPLVWVILLLLSLPALSLILAGLDTLKRRNRQAAPKK